jgi:hypothetical protein
LSAEKQPRRRGIFEAPSTSAQDLAIGANQIAANHPGLNPYELRNDILVEQEKDRICAENGQPAPARRPQRFFARYDAKGKTLETTATYTPVQLETDADREGANHRRTLDRNLKKDGQARVADVCAHHIVASGHPDAYRSRRMLFGWGIGINDADNGVFLPAYLSSNVPTLPNAVAHDRLRASARYYLRVEARLRVVDKTSQPAGRGALRKMRGEMVAGSFPLA